MLALVRTVVLGLLIGLVLIPLGLVVAVVAIPVFLLAVFVGAPVLLVLAVVALVLALVAGVVVAALAGKLLLCVVFPIWLVVEIVRALRGRRSAYAW
jgi:hypothetical protein